MATLPDRAGNMSVQEIASQDYWHNSWEHELDQVKKAWAIQKDNSTDRCRRLCPERKQTASPRLHSFFFFWGCGRTWTPELQHKCHVMHSQVWRATPGSTADNYDQVGNNVLPLLRPDQPVRNLFLINRWSIQFEFLLNLTGMLFSWFDLCGATMCFKASRFCHRIPKKSFCLLILRSSWWWIYRWKENLASPGWTPAKPSVICR